MLRCSQLLDLPTLRKAKSDLYSVMDISGLVRCSGKVKFRSDISTSIKNSNPQCIEWAFNLDQLVHATGVTSCLLQLIVSLLDV